MNQDKIKAEAIRLVAISQIIHERMFAKRDLFNPITRLLIDEFQAQIDKTLLALSDERTKARVKYDAILGKVQDTQSEMKHSVAAELGNEAAKDLNLNMRSVY